MSDQWRNSKHRPEQREDSPEIGDYCTLTRPHCRMIYKVKDITVRRDQWYRFYLCKLQPVFPRPRHGLMELKLLDLQRLTPLEVLAVASL